MVGCWCLSLCHHHPHYRYYHHITTCSRMFLYILRLCCKTAKHPTAFPLALPTARQRSLFQSKWFRFRAPPFVWRSTSGALRCGATWRSAGARWWRTCTSRCPSASWCPCSSRMLLRRPMHRALGAIVTRTWKKWAESVYILFLLGWVREGCPRRHWGNFWFVTIHFLSCK